MKKLVLCTIALMLLLGLAGCSKEDKKISADDVTENTFLAKSNGQIEVATIEDFDKAYYQLSELEEFVKHQIDTHNQASGGEKITISDIVEREGKAILILNYSGMDQYATFNEVTSAYFAGGVDNVSLELPSTLINSKNDSLASTEEILQNEKYKILVLNEPYHIIVDGKIKYYSEDTTLIDDNELQGAAEGMTIVVFK